MYQVRNVSRSCWTSVGAPARFHHSPSLSFEALEKPPNPAVLPWAGTGTTLYAYYPVTTPPTLGAGRLTSVDGPLANDTVTYVYDGLGRVKTRSLNGASNETSFTFDPYGRIRNETTLLGTFTFGYEGVTGRLASLSYPNGQTSSYTYFDNLNDRRLQEIHHKRPGGATLSRFTYTYDKVGNIVTWGQQRDTEPLQTWTYGYDLADQLTSASVAASPPTPSRYTYAYDPAGNRTAEQKDATPVGFTYDNMNRLTGRGPGGSIVFRGTVSEPAQVTLSTTSGTRPATTTPTAPPPTEEFRGQAPLPVQSGQTQVTVTAKDFDNPQNTTTQQYNINVSGASKAYLYDANGNLTFDGTKTYEWDAENRLLKVTEGATILATRSREGSGTTKPASTTTEPDTTTRISVAGSVRIRSDLVVGSTCLDMC